MLRRQQRKGKSPRNDEGKYARNDGVERDWPRHSLRHFVFGRRARHSLGRFVDELKRLPFNDFI